MMSPMAGDLRANREGYRRWIRVAWAATGVLWALLFFAGPDQVASNTFIDRRSDGSAAPDSLFQYVSLCASLVCLMTNGSAHRRLSGTP
jgi:hypothetical protein